MLTEIEATNNDIKVSEEKVPIFATKGADFSDYLCELIHVWSKIKRPSTYMRYTPRPDWEGPLQKGLGYSK
jgi:hypothetical protein